MKEVCGSFRAMNTDIVAIVGTPEDRSPEAERVLAEVEALFSTNEEVMSRFRPESELSRLNRSAGRPFRVTRRLLDVIVAALDAASSTGGIFDPTVLRDLIAAGYDRSFELLEDRPGDRQQKPTARTEGLCSWRDVQIDLTGLAVTLPAGCGIDLGGIGKGWTVDQAARVLGRFRNFAMDAGGDIYAAGRQADGSKWTIGIADPFDQVRDVAVLEVRDVAVATSTTSRRKWHGDTGQVMHHLIDPRTGMPGAGDVVSATVIAASVTRAEVLAKTALLLGSREGQSFLESQAGTDWMLVLANGETRRSSGLPEVRYAN